MTHFDLGYTRDHVLPILREILAINPNIKLLGSPGSPPAWMKTSKATRGGSLLPEYFDAYALYFVRYIQEMQKEGFTIDAITIQNEPFYQGNNPSALMLPTDQAKFVKQSLGPTFRKNSINTKILIFDHNCDTPDYPITVLEDADAKQYVDGSAFHLYGGEITALSTVHDRFPDKNIYFTEKSLEPPLNFKNDIMVRIRNLTVGASRNWAKVVLQWNLVSNSEFQPHTDTGCQQCVGATTVDDDRIVSRNAEYYVSAHASKFIRPNSIRIDSTIVSGLSNVAFRRTDNNENILVVMNDNETDERVFQIQCNDKIYNASLNGGSVCTYIC